jgi:ADP-glucose pyrophosphorylase
VSRSLLWDGVTVEAGACIDDAIVASRVRVGAGATIGARSVIGHDVTISPGSHVADDSRLVAEGVATA